MVYQWYEERKKKAAEALAKAPETAKPMYDMLDLWPKYGQPGDPIADSDYAAKTDALIKSWAAVQGLPFSLFLPGKSPVTPAEAPAEASDIIDRGLKLIIALNSIGVMAECASMGQVESVIWSMMNIINASGLPGIVGDLYRTPSDIGVKIPLERYINSVYQPRIPDPGTLARMLAKNRVSGEAFDFWMAENGYPHWAAIMLAADQERAPDFGSLLELYRRKKIDYESFAHWLKMGAMHTWAIPLLEKLRWQLPGYQDIISIYMREGYLEEKWVEIPSEFIEYMEEQGYGPEWAKRLWGKHWVLPGVNHLYEMFHKKIITADTMAQMLKYHDYEPVWRQRLIDNAYSMIPRVDLRRAYRYGMLKAEGLKERYEWLGFNSSDADIMAGIAERTSLDRYYTRLETVARAAYRKGKLSVEGFEAILKQINTPDAAIGLSLEAETLAREAAVLEPAEEPRSLTAAQILSLYRERILTKDVTLTRLTGLGYTSADAALLLSLSEPRPPAPDVNTDLVSAAAALYRNGLMGSDEFQGRLRKAGLSKEAIDAKVEAEELRYRLDYAQDLIAMFKQAYTKDVYTAEEFEDNLLAYGMQPERAAALVALEQLRKLPKPKAVS